MNDGSKGNRWIDPRCTSLSLSQRWPYIRLDNGALLSVYGNATVVSEDNGESWSEPQPIYRGEDGKVPAAGPGIPNGRGLLIQTRNGTLIIAWIDERVLNWNNDTGEPGEDATGDMWTIRSVDGGKSWIDRQCIYQGVCGHPPINMIQTRSGRVVVTAQYYLRHPGRNVIRVYSTADEGKSWRGSNIIDLGGHGHHDGAFEPTFVERGDGRLWMLIRTNWDRFWEAFSDDEGLSWRILRPSAIESSTSPGYLARLASGRLALLWSQLYPEGADSFPRRSGQCSEAEASWHREELSIAFSEDDGERWSKPVVLAREKDTWISYPYLFEVEPGLFWICSGQGNLQVRAREADLLEY